MLINYWRAEKLTLSPADQKLIQVAQKQIPSNFCTIDFARTASGQLIIMEMGDGQVSGLQGYDESTFYKLLRKNLDLDL